jgi:hypothetical protein
MRVLSTAAEFGEMEGEMSDRDRTSVLYIPLLAALAMLYPVVGRRSGPNSEPALAFPSGNNQTAPATTEEEEWSRGRRAVWRFFDPLRKNESPPTSNSAVLGAASLNFLVVTIPDPNDSGLPHAFDRYMTSIRMALQAPPQSYFLNRFNLPWLDCLSGGNADDPVGSHRGTNSADKTGTKAKDCDDRRYLKEPGFLLLSNPTDTNRVDLLLVYLVGESPALGIRKKPLLLALNEISRFCGWRRNQDHDNAGDKDPIVSIARQSPTCKSPSQTDRGSEHNSSLRPGPGTLSILGPSYSGSEQSLDLALRYWLDTLEVLPGVNVISGSATSIKHKSKEVNFQFARDKLAEQFQFRSMLIPDDVAGDRLCEFLQSKSWQQPLKVAMLREGGTVYGAEENPASEDPEAREKSNCPDVEITRIPYPLHISQLRAASEKVRQDQEQANPQPQISDNKVLPLSESLQEAGLRRDIPPFSRADALTAEQVMASLLSTLSRENYNYVGILATDVRDTMFLAQEVREHSPGSVLFTYGTELLYLHPEINSKMRGMLMVGTYPLIEPNQYWSTPSRSGALLQFPDEPSEGVYNAALALLGKETHLREYSPPFHTDCAARQEEKSARPAGKPKAGGERSDCSESAKGPQESEVKLAGQQEKLAEPNAKLAGRKENSQPPEGGEAGPHKEEAVLLRPPVWITVVGRDRFLPVETYDESGNEDVAGYMYGLRRNKAKGFVTEFWWRGLYPPHTTVLVSLFSVLCIGFCWFTFSLSRGSRWTPSPACGPASESSHGFGAQPAGSAWSDLTTHRREALIELVPACASLAAFLLPLDVSLLVPWITIRGDLGASTGWSRDLLWIASTTMLASVSIILLLVSAAVLLRRILWRRKGAVATMVIPAFHLWGAPLLCSGIVLLMSLAVAGKWLRQAIGEDAGYQGLFSSIRSLDFLDGVSPLVPLFFICAAGFLWSVLSWYRRRMFEAAEVPIPAPEDRARFLMLRGEKLVQIKNGEGKIRGLLECSALGLPRWWLVAGVIVAGGVYIFAVFVSELERTGLYWLLGISFVLVSTALWFGVLRFFCVWKEVERLLQQVACTPLRKACKRFRASYPVPLKLDLASPVPSLAALSFSVDQARNLNLRARQMAATRDVQAAAVTLSLTGTQGGIPLFSSRESELTPRTLAGLSWLGSEEISRQVGEADRFLTRARGTGKDLQGPVVYQWCAQGHLALLTGEISDVLEDDWWNEPHSACERPGPRRLEAPENMGAFELAEDFLVGRLVHFLGYVLPQMQQLIFTSVVGVLLLLLAVHSYPFQPHNVLLGLNWAVVLSLVGIALWVFTQMNRNPILSYLNGTKPGQISWDREFVGRMLVYGLVPILALLGAQFPDSVGQIVSHIIPNEAMHH